MQDTNPYINLGQLRLNANYICMLVSHKDRYEVFTLTDRFNVGKSDDSLVDALVKNLNFKGYVTKSKLKAYVNNNRIIHCIVDANGKVEEIRLESQIKDLPKLGIKISEEIFEAHGEAMLDDPTADAIPEDVEVQENGSESKTNS